MDKSNQSTLGFKSPFPRHTKSDHHTDGTHAKIKILLALASREYTYPGLASPEPRVADPMDPRRHVWTDVPFQVGRGHTCGPRPAPGGVTRHVGFIGQGWDGVAGMQVTAAAYLVSVELGLARKADGDVLFDSYSGV